jgi:hypothetical protein
MAKILDPYDGAVECLLPDGRQCYEKETCVHGGSEIFPIYQYSVDIGVLDTDYYGQVVGIKYRFPSQEGRWAEKITFCPATRRWEQKISKIISAGWELHASSEPGPRFTRHYMTGAGYLDAMSKVMEAISELRRCSR